MKEMENELGQRLHDAIAQLGDGIDVISVKVTIASVLTTWFQNHADLSCGHAFQWYHDPKMSICNNRESENHRCVSESWCWNRTSCRQYTARRPVTTTEG